MILHLHFETQYMEISRRNTMGTSDSFYPLQFAKNVAKVEKMQIIFSSYYIT